MRGLQAVAERVARARSERILARIAAAIAEHAPDARVEDDGDALRARGRRLKRRWLGEPALRFARWTRP